MGERTHHPAYAIERIARATALEEAARIADECAELWDDLPRDAQVARDVARAIREAAGEQEWIEYDPATGEIRTLPTPSDSPTDAGGGA